MFDRLRENAAWREALRLTTRAFALSEDIPAEDQQLALDLRIVAVETSGEIAAALADNRRVDNKPLFKLFALLEVINEVYPAIDTAPVEKSLKSLVDALDGSSEAAR